MTFPTLAGETSGAESSATTSHSVTLPGSIASGDTLIIEIASRPSTWTTPSGWTLIVGQTAGTRTNGAAYYKKAAGGETSVSITSGSSVAAAWRARRYSSAADPAINPPEGTTDYNSDATTNTPDPPSLTPTGGAKDYQWSAFYFQRDDNAALGYPTNYSNTGTANDTSTFVACGWGDRDLNASSENPGTFSTNDTYEVTTFTIAIHPPAAGEATPKFLTLLGVG